MGRKALGAMIAPAMLALLVMPASAAASPLDPSGVIKLVSPAPGHANGTQSSNWFGYDAGALERGGTLFNSISAQWTVPTASPHVSGRAADSSTWIGVGGGCVAAGCALADATLIQAGTEQDVDSAGHASYSAWWELVPTPATTIENFSVSPGDRISTSIAEVVPNSELWTITLRDITKGETFSTTVPYSSTHATGEWIDETPLAFGTGGVGEASLPNLGETPFEHATVNGAPARLTSAEAVQLVDSRGSVIGTPSAPDATATAFADCAWTNRCDAPSTGVGPGVAPRRSAPGHRRSHKRRRHKHRRHSRR